MINDEKKNYHMWFQFEIILYIAYIHISLSKCIVELLHKNFFSVSALSFFFSLFKIEKF